MNIHKMFLTLQKIQMVKITFLQIPFYPIKKFSHSKISHSPPGFFSALQGCFKDPVKCGVITLSQKNKVTKRAVRLKIGRRGGGGWTKFEKGESRQYWGVFIKYWGQEHSVNCGAVLVTVGFIWCVRSFLIQTLSL